MRLYVATRYLHQQWKGRFRARPPKSSNSFNTKPVITDCKQDGLVLGFICSFNFEDWEFELVFKFRDNGPPSLAAAAKPL